MGISSVTGWLLGVFPKKLQASNELENGAADVSLNSVMPRKKGTSHLKKFSRYYDLNAKS